VTYPVSQSKTAIPLHVQSVLFETSFHPIQRDFQKEQAEHVRNSDRDTFPVCLLETIFVPPSYAVQFLGTIIGGEKRALQPFETSGRKREQGSDDASVHSQARSLPRPW
jgi:hypothetical protein